MRAAVRHAVTLSRLPRCDHTRAASEATSAILARRPRAHACPGPLVGELKFLMYWLRPPALYYDVWPALAQIIGHGLPGFPRAQSVPCG